MSKIKDQVGGRSIEYVQDLAPCRRGSIEYVQDYGPGRRREY